MSNQGGHQHRRHKRRNPINEFLDSLRGKKRRTYHRTDFPGITLPEDYDPVKWKERGKFDKPEYIKEEEEPEDIKEKFTEQAGEDVSRRPGKTDQPKRKRSFWDSFDLYLRQREFRQEERYKEKLRRDHRRKADIERRKRERKSSKGKIFNFTHEYDDGDPTKKPALFSQRSPFYRNFTIAFNSSLIFIVSYILVYLFYWLNCMLIASFFGLDSILYYYDLKFNDHSPLWDRLNILIVTGIPPFLCLILAIFLLQVVFKMKRFAGLQKLFILWTAFHLFNHFFGAFPSGIVTDEGFGYVAAWLYLNTAFKFMFSLISLFILGAIGYFASRNILETSDSYHRIKGDNRLLFIFVQMVIPWFVGTLTLLLLRIPENFNYPYETLMLFSTMFLVFPAFFNEKVKPELNLMKVKKRRHINMGYLAMALVLLVFLRYVLAIGLHFIIEINISISPAS